MQPARTLTRLLVLSALLAAAGCRERPTEEAPPPTVTVAPVVEREIQDFVVFTGRTAAVQSVDVRARVSGYLTEQKFKDGAEVKKDDVLFIIDPRPYQADFDRAQAEFNRAEADRQLAELEFNRAKELRSKNTISAQDFDTKAANMLAAQSSAAAARAARDTAKLNLEFTSIASPIDGQTSRASVTPGNLVTPDMKDPLTTIVMMDPIYAYGDIDERQLLKYVRLNEELRKSGAAEPDGANALSMQLADETGFPHEGVIDFADNRVNADTGTITFRGIFANPKKILGPGLFVRLRLPGGLPYKALLVPQEAIGTDQGQKFVYVVGADNKVDYRRVMPGALQDDGMRAVAGPLAAGESVIVEGMMKARPGEAVKPEPYRAAQAAASPAAAVAATPAPAESPAPAPAAEDKPQ